MTAPVSDRWDRFDAVCAWVSGLFAAPVRSVSPPVDWASRLRGCRSLPEIAEVVTAAGDAFLDDVTFGLVLTLASLHRERLAERGYSVEPVIRINSP